MLLILMRHAQAVPVGEGGISDDFDRHLTAFGQRQAAAVADHLAGLSIRLDAVMTSPLARARETAELVSGPALVSVAEEFASGNLDFVVMAGAVAAANGETVAAVGHMPDVAGFARWLLGHGIGGFETAQAVAIRFPNGPAEGQGRVEWTFIPAV